MPDRPAVCKIGTASLRVMFQDPYREQEDGEQQARGENAEYREQKDREDKTIESGRGWNIEEWHDLAPTTYSCGPFAYDGSHTRYFDICQQTSRTFWLSRKKRLTRAERIAPSEDFQVAPN
jgi:hypothetical protein